MKGAFTRQRTQRLHILEGVSGVLRPGTMTLVLGQPGSGKSTFLKVLGGLLHRSGVEISGEVTYNSLPQHALAKHLPRLVAYVPQGDDHFSLLTVRETLAFAKDVRGGKADLDDVKYHLGLEHCWDTIVGDAMVRGVSGGEKKRVTTGEMHFGSWQAVLLDEISTGLDSATTFDIVNVYRELVRSLGKIVVASLLQPTPEVLALFDDVLLLHSGRVLYYGSVGRVVDYFKGLGLECPPTTNVADFMMDLGTAQQQKYERRSDVPRSAADYASCFINSDLRVEYLRQLHAPAQLTPDALVATRPFAHPPWVNALSIASRQLKLLWRDMLTLRSRVVLVLLVGAMDPTIFRGADPTNAPALLGGIFLSSMFLVFEQTSQLATFLGMRSIFYKQRAANFFQTSAYVLGNLLSQLPGLLLEVLVFGSMMYWIAGYEADAARFLIYLVILFFTSTVTMLIFFFVTAASPTVYLTVPAGLAVVQVALGFSGYLIARSQLPDFLVWIYWINPMSWAYAALAVNQYLSPTFDVCAYENVDYCTQFGKTMGAYYLDLMDLPTDRVWIVYAIVFLLGASVVFTVLCCLVLEYKRYDNGPTGGVVQDSDGDEYHPLVTPRRSGDLKVTINHETNVTPVTLAFKDLWYSVPNPKKPNETINLLNGISGYAKPGTITALMGSSGAGKTTLLDVLAGRKNSGVVRGEVLLNGHPATDFALRRVAGYCEQMGIHSATATVRESLAFSAFLRQGSEVPDAWKAATVDECLELLGLESIADKLAGSCSLEESKRLTIGVELAAQPSLLFLDEPTSGLDARAAKLVMDGVRKAADSGRTVICTIHQPSADVFSVFDCLLLLQRGGETVFFGHLNASHRLLVEYFEAIDGVAPLPRDYNPATWMLEVIGAGVSGASARDKDFGERFRASDLKRQLDTDLLEGGVGIPSTSTPPLAFTSRRAASGVTQLTFLLRRFFRMYWRSPAHYLTLYCTAIGAVVIFGLAGTKLSSTTFQGLTSGLGIIFMAHQFQSYVSFNSAIPFALADRSAFYREQAAHTYSPLWYFVASTLVEVPFVALKSLLISVGLFLFMSYTGFTNFVLFWLASSLGMLVEVYMGQLLAFLLPNAVLATLTGSIVGSICFVFVGLLPPGGAIPSWYQWLYTINPLRYGMPIMVALVYGDCSSPDGSQLGCRRVENSPVSVGELTVKQLVENVYNMKHDEIGRNFWVLAVFIAIFRVLALLAMQFLRHEKR